MSSAFVRSLADRQMASGNQEPAGRLYTVSGRIDPQNWRAWLGLGQLYSQKRYYELDPAAKSEWVQKEVNIFSVAYQHNPKKEEVVYGLGRAELAAGNRERGLALLRQAANYKQFNDFYWRKLGIELRKNGIYQEALEAFLHAKKLNPADSTAVRNIQWLRERL